MTFDLILIGGRGIVMDYLYAEFGNFGLSRFGLIVQAETESQTESRRRMITDTHCYWPITTGLTSEAVFCSVQQCRPRYKGES